MRYTTMRFITGEIKDYSDIWKDPGEHLGELQEWTGITQFIVGPDNSIPAVRMNSDDFWFKDHYSWIRAHIHPRSELYVPDVGAPALERLVRLTGARRTTCYLEDGSETVVEDNWRVVGEANSYATVDWNYRIRREYGGTYGTSSRLWKSTKSITTSS